MSKVIMVQGTMLNAGKSLLVAGLCRIMRQDRYRVAPFKSQNMALNSYITKEGLEMERAQVMQAEAAGIESMICMNPILLKPTDHTGSQVIVNGEVLSNMSARLFSYKKLFIPDIRQAFCKLEEYADIIVIEGAGSPAEIILPGSKNTMEDLKWMRQNGLEAAIKGLAQEIPVFGICGGYQMLREQIAYPDCVEEGGTLRGMELLPVTTELQKDKIRCQTKISGNEQTQAVTSDGHKNVYGTYIHGIFDKGRIANAIVQTLAMRKGITIEDGRIEDYQSFKKKQYDKLADTLRKYLDMEKNYGIIKEAHLE